ncbi:Oxidoreductase sirO [Pseudocercospora fuligena]|uniref:Oxidoreductase sirO n=1 Tax=Pseudocercospora fuligena TaxID=685502 RepID=A0A8H6RHI2_9PEZI|nr:Oxidoreductase sirO [Pseudocercospora fuligena]
MSGIKVVFGGSAINPDRGFGDIKKLQEAFDLLEQGGCHTIDTASLYGDSEKILGEAGAPKRFTIDTKTRGGFNPNGGANKANITSEVQTNANTDLEETLSAINEVYKSGFFKRFGLSNYQAEDVQKVYDHCKAKGYPLPQVYQGNYSAVARKQEQLLFPTLRKLNMSFYAYSPLAGGFLVKSKEQIASGAGRFNTGTALSSMYTTMYGKQSYLDALDQWASIAEDEGVTKADLAYRWVRYSSPLKPEHGDAIIIGASKVEQLKETLSSINSGPLSENAVKRIDQVWETIKHEAPLDNFHL